MLREDVNLQLNDIQMLSDRSQVAAFFGRLGYDLETRLPLTPEALSITSAELQRQITHVEQIANQGGELYVYLFEMKAMRAADRLALARAFRNASGEFLLAITSDYQALDFVLLERQLPESTATGISRKQVAIHPHVLSVNRANPDPVDLRVLRRFSYTEDDPFYQYDKLLSAYTVAEWSEPLFNNRALFSDYYLNTRLRDSAEWGEDPLPIYQQLHALLANVRARLAAEDEATTRRKLLEPAFEALGFRAEAFPNGTEDPDYRLYDPQAGPDAAPLVRCLTYKWDRYLDGPDEQRDDETPDENPAAKVVSLLEDGETPYVIVTNGKLWRLYAARAHSRATNYYEIDLSEAILPADAADRADSIRYFWLFFRRDAFTPQAIMREGEQREVCFLDRLLEGSAAYAKELEERLKDRIFEQIFPHFAEGFITYIRQTEGKDADLSQARLDGIYRGTLTFLYRLMFLLYAEARDLLPVKDDHGYHTASLRRLKTEIAARAGTIEDAAPAAIRKTFAENSNALYDRLAALFVVIDRGAPSLNVPRYNGGLFITQPPEDGDSPEYEDARFLRDCKIPDRFLALGLDRLARDVDAKTHALVMIDYKSLGVRQLGSIYEGLLEFKLRVAPEKMAIVKGKRTEEVIPYRGANKKDILTTGRGQNKQERTLPKGAVYLENTRQERKATGSYYTPDYIVKYIVEHTVGPVLDEKFKVLSPRLAEAERLYHQRRKNALAKGEDSEKFWNRDDMQSLAYDVLDVKVLDPAMGSGHFLVEAVDFITDRMIKFLNGYRHNPVWASLKRTRTSILDAMDDQGVSIDHKQLDEIPLLKRQVLKRCVYGVDLNPMAVELAKVSLWLDAFTLGAPLSFLDHHLRHGNSLIGTMARDAEIELQRKQLDEGRQQLSLWGGPFVGLLRQAEIMRGIGTLADATIEQAHQSADLFGKFEEAARPYKQLLDVFVIRHFGVKEAGDFLMLYGADVMTTDPAALKGPYREVLKERAALYQQYRFFHWDLEFPEVFIDLEHAQWKENAGFDAVVGNPPYVLTSEKEDSPEFRQRVQFRRALENMDYATLWGRWDVFVPFIERSLRILKASGFHSFITSNSLEIAPYAERLRNLIIDAHRLHELHFFKGFQVFDGVGVTPIVYVIEKEKPPRNSIVRCFHHLVPDMNVSCQEIGQFTVGEKIFNSEFDLVLARGMQGTLTSELKTICYIGSGAQMQSDQDNYRGEFTKDDIVAIDHSTEFSRPYIEGKDISRYEVMQIRYVAFDKNRAKIKRPRFRELFENPNFLLSLSGQGLLQKTPLSPYGWFYPNHSVLICVRWSDLRGVNNRSIDKTMRALNIERQVIESESTHYDMAFVAALCNSKYLLTYAKNNLTRHKLFIQAEALGHLPIRRIDFTTSADRREQLAGEGRVLYERSLDEGHAPVLAFTDRHMTADETDVIHDLLAFLAETMIDLNKQKQAETRRFLAWLEEQIGAAIDDLSGKTIIQGYLGDCQKGEPETPFEEVYDRLHKNKRKITANLNDAAFEARVRAEYERSLGVLLPVKRQLAHTDTLIDQVVYRLYGLTEDEIAIVEGRG